MKQSIGNRTWKTGVFLFFFLFSASFLPVKIPPSTVHIIYTGNLNCSLDDCRCGGDIAGGFTRIITVIDSLKSRYPDAVVLDAGDHFNSYSLPEANRVMAELLYRARYTALNLGDQEFVESTDFLLKIQKDVEPPLPFLSSNIVIKNGNNHFADPIKSVNIAGIPVTMWSIIDPAAFEFISPDSLINITPSEKALEARMIQIERNSGMEILLFHGRAEKAAKLIEKFPWIDVVVLAHNQALRYDRKEETVFVESGAEGEYIGHLQVRRAGDSWEFQNEFIPIYYRIPPDPAAQKKVDEYYRRLK